MPPTLATLRLSRLRVSNLRSIGELDVPLLPLTVLVGPNGSGKSNIVDALRLLRDCLTRGLDQTLLERNGLSALRHWTPGKAAAPVSLGVTATLGDNPADYVAYDFTLAADPRLGHVVQQEQLRIGRAGRPAYVLTRQADGVRLVRDGKNCVPSNQEGARMSAAPNQLLGPGLLANLLFGFPATHALVSQEDMMPELFLYQPVAVEFSALLYNSLFYTLPPAPLRLPQQATQDGRLDETGQNLAAVLRRLRRTPRVAAEVQATLRRLLDEVEDFSVRSTGSFLVAYLHYQNVTGRGTQGRPGPRVRRHSAGTGHPGRPLPATA